MLSLFATAASLPPILFSLLKMYYEVLQNYKKNQWIT